MKVAKAAEARAVRKAAKAEEVTKATNNNDDDAIPVDSAARQAAGWDEVQEALDTATRKAWKAVKAMKKAKKAEDRAVRKAAKAAEAAKAEKAANASSNNDDDNNHGVNNHARRAGASAGAVDLAVASAGAADVAVANPMPVVSTVPVPVAAAPSPLTSTLPTLTPKTWQTLPIPLLLRFPSSLLSQTGTSIEDHILPQLNHHLATTFWGFGGPCGVAGQVGVAGHAGVAGTGQAGQGQGQEYIQLQKYNPYCLWGTSNTWQKVRGPTVCFVRVNADPEGRYETEKVVECVEVRLRMGVPRCVLAVQGEMEEEQEHGYSCEDIVAGLKWVVKEIEFGLWERLLEMGMMEEEKVVLVGDVKVDEERV